MKNVGTASNPLHSICCVTYENMPMLHFIDDPTIPFANTLAEHAVHMPKVKQEFSGCFRTLDGVENFCVIRSCLDTLGKQGHGMRDVLQRAVSGNPIRAVHSC
ncbi:MAG: hypothetical protein Q7U12_08825 [Undibacterium sp.]|nr:hypothetical protein [Undibacterium sp.]